MSEDQGIYRDHGATSTDSPNQIPGRVGDTEHTTKKRPWRPRILSWWVFLGLNLFSMAEFLVIVLLLALSGNQPGSTYEFAYGNAAAFFFWKFCMVIIQVVLGMVWLKIYAMVLYMEPFYRMTVGGATAKDSVSLDISSFALIAPFEALYKRKYVLSLAATISAMSFTILPVLIDQGWDINLSDDNANFTVNMRIPVIAVTLLLIVVVTIAALFLGYLLHTRESEMRLPQNPAGIAGLASLIAHSDDLLKLLRTIDSRRPQSYIDEKLDSMTFSLEEQSSGPDDTNTTSTFQIIVRPLPNSTVNENSADDAPFQEKLKDSRSLFLTKRVYISFQLSIMAIYIGFVRGGDSLLAVHIMKPIMFFAFLGFSSYWATVDEDTRLLQPFYSLSIDVKSGPAPLEALTIDWTTVLPMSDWKTARLLKAGLVFAAGFGLITSQGISIILPAFLEAFIQQSAQSNAMEEQGLNADYNYHLGGFWEHGAKVLEALAIIFGFVFIVSLYVVALKGSKPIMPRMPSTLSSRMMYVCNSHMLLNDVGGTSIMSPKERYDKLKEINHTYAFGRFKSPQDGEREVVGIEVVTPGGIEAYVHPDILRRLARKGRKP